MTPRDTRPQDERGPVDWGTSRPAQSRPGRRQAPVEDPEVLDDGPDWGVGRGSAPRRSAPAPGDGPDWGVGRARPVSTGRGATPWPAAVRAQRLSGVLFALVGLALATVSAMNLARNAEAGQLWIPPWLVAVLFGAGLVSAAGYLAWAGGTPVRRESERWQPRLVDAAAGLTAGTVEVADPNRLLGAGPSASAPPQATVDSGPRPIMGTSTVDQSAHAPAGVAGAVGGFMMAGAVVCAVIALVLGPAWLIATGALALGGIVAVYLAGDWLGRL